MSLLLQPVPAVFRRPLPRSISDADLLQAWAHVPSSQITLTDRSTRVAERERVIRLRQRVLDLRAAAGVS